MRLQVCPQGRAANETLAFATLSGAIVRPLSRVSPPAKTSIKQPQDIKHKTYGKSPENYIKQRRDTFVFYALILLALVESKKMRLNQNKLSL